jgi:hypothetical protein
VEGGYREGLSVLVIFTGEKGGARTSADVPE